MNNPNNNIYQLKASLVTPIEKRYISIIQSILPERYFLIPQVCLRSIIEKVDNSRYASELFRLIDIGIFEKNTYKPIMLIEINDKSHHLQSRRERDQKVRNICEEAGIPLVTFWQMYNIDIEYVKETILTVIKGDKNSMIVQENNSFDMSWNRQTVNIPQQNYIPQNSVPNHSYPPQFNQRPNRSYPPQFNQIPNYTYSSQFDQNSNRSYYQNNRQPRVTVTLGRNNRNSRKGCYIATCVYGSYDCAEVWTLRRYRDNKLQKSIFGRFFIKIYYFISPVLVKYFGTKQWFLNFWQKYGKMIH